MSGYFGGALGYVKKEDASRVLKYQRLYPSIIATGLLVILVVMEMWVMPKLLELYATINIEMPFYSTPYLRWGVMGAIILLLVKQPISEENDLKGKLKKYKDGEMILIADLIDKKREWFALLMVALAMIWLIVSIVLPIYQATAAI